MSSATIGQVVNYVKMHPEFFGLPIDKKVQFSECMSKFRVSLFNTKEMQLFDFYKFDHTARVFLPKLVKKYKLSEALVKVKDIRFEDFLNDDSDIEWEFMQVTPNRMIIFDRILKNSTYEIDKTPIAPLKAVKVVDPELVKAQEKIKELEAKLAQYKQDEPRVITNYIALKGTVAEVDVGNSIGHMMYHFNLNNGTYDIQEAIDKLDSIAAGLMEVARNLERAQYNGAKTVRY